ncbi:copper chaperone PCu(A)C [Streptomyces phaeochromogenes]|uniref:copper chaperone PCu(A)C n=1 Tax=Streptomyces phaeochromogenes TaxID=1923 RepID=UPI00225351B7|nr:copper chaperone PCu(A)C [Streptomyces phaeochromogenes]MCX5604947.1 copper chaperone PCu(A)C [Streptomyces phaeochromogenes]WRZ30787.1 copper chaperone PCu(A)C [Streptomyces phaeochromogenes]
MTRRTAARSVSTSTGASAAALVVAAALALAGCGDSDSGSSEPELSVGSVYMPQPVSDSMAAGFLVVANAGGVDDRLSSVTSDIAGEVTLHTTSGQSMTEVKNLDVPGHGKLVLESGGNHLMFEKLKRKPKEGDKVSLELHFTKSGPMKVEMPVKSPTYRPTATTKSSLHSSTQSSSTSHH